MSLWVNIHQIKKHKEIRDIITYLLCLSRCDMNNEAYKGSIEDAFLRIRNRTNNLIANFLPEGWKRLNSAFELLESTERTKWSSAVHACRGILEDLADVVFPATSEGRIFKGKKFLPISHKTST